MRYTLTTIFCTLLSTYVLAQGVSIDGSISFQELSDTVHFVPMPSPSANLLLKKNRDFIYVGVHSAAAGGINLVLNRKDEFVVLHISGCTGRALYMRVSGDSLVVTKPILDVSIHPEAWDYTGRFVTEHILHRQRSNKEMELEREKCLQLHGYMASTFEEGSYRDVEILLDKKVFGSYKLLVQSTEINTSLTPPQVQRQFYPQQGFTGNRNAMVKFLEAAPGTSLRVNFTTSEWIDLSSN